MTLTGEGHLLQRQVHLDFHTAPEIPEIAANFDAEAFAQTFVDAHVQSVTVFSKCHHGYSYHPTSVGAIHPGLSFDLLRAQIDALHAVGIKAPIYHTVGWDEYIADLHPEWLLTDEHGRLCGRAPDQNRGWRLLDFATPYAEYMLASLKELLDRYDPVDGIFLDIVRQEHRANFNPLRRQRMRDDGVDLHDQVAGDTWAMAMERGLLDRCAQLVRESNPGATLFFNSRLRVDEDPALGTRGELQHFTHIEIESLPSGDWGYNHFPLTSAYFQTLDTPVMGMTGIFHTAWGDFGSVKTDAALHFECARMLAAGTTCSVGDQLHPDGKPDPRAYRTLGRVFERVAALEPWTVATTSVPEVGILMAQTGPRFHTQHRESDEGAIRMMLELHRPFHLLDRDVDLDPARYPVLIAPDVVAFDDAMTRKLTSYLDAGGALLLTDRSGFDMDRGTFAFSDRLGIERTGEAAHSPDFIALEPVLHGALPEMADSPQVLYERGSHVRLTGLGDVLARVGQPFFDRTPDRYMSHRHWPLERVSDEPAIVQSGSIIYCHSPLFRAYRQHAAPAYRDIVGALLDRLVPTPLVSFDNLPTSAEIGLLEQMTEGSRYVLHLLHAIPQRRGTSLDIIEDGPALRDVVVKVRVPTGRAIEVVTLAPSGETLSSETTSDGMVVVLVPEVATHQVVVFTWSED